MPATTQHTTGELRIGTYSVQYYRLRGGRLRAAADYDRGVSDRYVGTLTAERGEAIVATHADGSEYAIYGAGTSPSQWED